MDNTYQKHRIVDLLNFRIIEVVGYIFETPTQIRFWYLKGELLVNESLAAHNARVLRCIGLKDKTNADIFEGDVLTDDRDDDWIVAWDKEDLCYVLQHIDVRNNYNSFWWLIQEKQINVKGRVIKDHKIFDSIYSLGKKKKKKSYQVL